MRTLYLAMLVLLCGCDEELKVPREVLGVQYGTDEAQVMDLYFPPEPGPDAPLVILIHGGAWAFGSKDDAYTQAFIAPLNDAGMVACPINFRLADSIPGHQLADIGTAIAEGLGQCARLGLGQSRVFVVGFSSGGHLALQYAYAGPGGGQVAGVVSVSGPTDLTAQDLRDRLAFHGFLWGLEQFVGGTYDSIPDAYRAASPVAAASGTPTFLLHGTADDIVPYTQASALRDSLVAKGFPSTFTSFEGAGHDLLFADEATGVQLIQGVVNWIRSN